MYNTREILAERPYPLQIEGVYSMPVQTCTLPPLFTFEDLPKAFSYMMQYTSI